MTLHVTYITGDPYYPEDFLQRDNDWIAPGVVTLSDLQVTAQSPAAMTVNVSGAAQGSTGGNAWLPGGYRIYSDTTLALPVATADPANPRIDLVVCGVNTLTNPYTPTIEMITGTAAPSPVAPATPTGYIALAQIAVAANATSITNANITDERALAALQGDGSALTGITAAQVGAVPTAAVGITVASLVSGQVPASQLGNVPAVGSATTTTAGVVKTTGTSGVAVTTDDAAYEQITGSKYVTAGTGISVASGTNGQTVTNTGVTGLTAGTNIALSGASGDVTISVTGTVPNATTATNATELNGQPASYYATASSVPTNVMSAISGGYRVQSGLIVTSATPQNVTFPDAFNTTPIVVITENAAPSEYEPWIVNSVSTTGFTASSNYGNANYSLSWIAIGT